MLENTNAQNSKVVVVRRFCGFLLAYYIISCFLFYIIENIFTTFVTYFLGYSDVDIARGLSNPFIAVLIFWICSLLYILLSLFCFITKRKFVCSPSKISSFHCFLLLFPFIVLFVSCLFEIKSKP